MFVDPHCIVDVRPGSGTVDPQTSMESDIIPLLRPGTGNAVNDFAGDVALPRKLADTNRDRKKS